MDSVTQRLIMGAAGAGGAEKIYVEDVFSTWLYTGTGATQEIVNGIDLSGKGGLAWIKSRSDGTAATSNIFYDTNRGAGNALSSSSTLGQQVAGANAELSAFKSDGFSLRSGVNFTPNLNTATFASWTFRKAAKFFDVVSYTGSGTNRTIAHSLGSVPGCIIVKRTDSAADWQVYHRSIGNTNYLVLNDSIYNQTGTTRWNSTTPTSTVFSLGTDATVNASGGTYVAYLFAHDAGGFGDSGNESVVKCGSFTSATAGTFVDLGWEPQWVLMKITDAADSWRLFDNMRGIPVGSSDAMLQPNATSAETTNTNFIEPSATGFRAPSDWWGAYNVIYIAIRRGPMKTPTDATKVFQAKLYTGTNVDNRLVTTDIVTDMAWVRQRNDTVLGGMVVGDRLRDQPYLLTGTTAAEVNDANSFDKQLVGGTEYGTAFSSMTGFWVGNDATSKLNVEPNSNSHLAYAFRRAPGFFDVVSYMGTNTGTRSISHGLGSQPQLILIKSRSLATGWSVLAAAGIGSGSVLLGNATAVTPSGLNYSAAFFTGGNTTSFVSASSFQVGSGFWGTECVDTYAATYIAYLFASCPGVSKVGSYTGTGTTLDVDCGFTNGARFVLIKRTDLTGTNWFVWDTARGITSGNDPYLNLNTTSAENTVNDFIDPLSSGFQISSTAPAAINASGGTFIYLAIA